MKNKVILSLSGGLDSSTLLAYMLNKELQVHCIISYSSEGKVGIITPFLHMSKMDILRRLKNQE
jgi:asparagine synthetase B (glutamine-hydrolysing)